MYVPMDEIESSKPVVFFDGSCPLCSREICHYRKLKGAENIVWVDAANNAEVLDKHGLSKDAAMARFHVLDKNGKWQTGAFGFAEMWSQLSAYRWVAALVTRLRLLPLMDKIYVRFAQWRLRRQCSDDACGVKP